MIARLTATVILLLLAFGAFWGNALGSGYLMNPVGLLFSLLAAVTWLKWEAVREAFKSVKNETDIPIIRLGSKIIGGMGFMRHGPSQRRSSSN